MEEYSRPAPLEDLKALIRALNEHGADYFLIGGYALLVHGYYRATTDIDVLVPATVDVADEFIVDIMLSAGGETYDTLKQHAETIDLEGLQVRTVNLEGLLRTKQSMRDKDAADRVIIERALEALGRRPGKE